MKRYLCCVLLGALMASPAVAQTAGMLSFQGLIKDKDGKPIKDPVDLTFTIYDRKELEEGEVQSGPFEVKDVTPREGIVSTRFGPVRADAFDGNQRWLEVSVDGNALSRIEMATAPATAEQVNIPESGNPAITVDGNGNVGIGTTVPGGSKLLLAGNNANKQLLSVLSNTGPGGKSWATISAANGNTIGVPGGAFVIRNLTDNVNAVVVHRDGNVGIGTTQPIGKLHIRDLAEPGNGLVVQKDFVAERVVASQLLIQGLRDRNQQQLILGYHTKNNYGSIQAIEQNVRARPLALQPFGGGVGIGTTNPQAKLHVVGTVRMSVAQITGADVAEKFPVTEEVNAGMVVAIDPNHPGKLCLARGAYNRRVAGIVSGANGLPTGAILGNLPGNEEAPPIALSGRVWCWCDASFGAIQPGDLLTTSSTPGHAMRVGDHQRAIGAMLGKAMTGLQEGKGLVLVLVSLQ